MSEKVLVEFKKSDLLWLQKEAKENNRTVSDMCQQLIHLYALGLFDYKYKFRNFVSVEWLEKWCKEYSIMHPIRKYENKYIPDVIDVKHLLSAVRKQAKVKK